MIGAIYNIGFEKGLYLWSKVAVKIFIGTMNVFFMKGESI